MRQAKAGKDVYVEKPSLNQLMIKFEEFKELFLQKGIPAAQVQEMKNVLARLGDITPGLISETNNILNV